MPSLFRFLFIVGTAGAIVTGALYVLAPNFEPEPLRYFIRMRVAGQNLDRDTRPCGTIAGSKDDSRRASPQLRQELVAIAKEIACRWPRRLAAVDPGNRLLQIASFPVQSAIELGLIVHAATGLSSDAAQRAAQQTLFPN